MLRALANSRLLVAVMAVADEIADDGSDKSSHMAVVSMVNSAGEKGLLAFHRARFHGCLESGGTPSTSSGSGRGRGRLG
jgi:hypothetical protein